MFKKLLFTGIGAALLASPLMASAASIADLQAQIANLIAQIRVLETGSSTVGVGAWTNATSSIATPNLATPMPCYAFTRSLSRGVHGDDVKSLQQFLYDQGFFDGYMTGYFGTQTEGALQSWQSHEGVAARGSIGFGIFGPVSRDHFKKWCGNPRQIDNQSFSADPQSGPAPLATTFTTNDSINATTTSYSVDFGDGANAQMTKGSCIAITAIRGGQGGIRCSYTVQHTYTADGTYTAKLLKQKQWSCPDGMMCAMMMPAPQTVGTLTITVGSTSANDQRINAPASVTLAPGGIAEIRNESAYFTLTALGTSTATIQVTRVGCWNSFPSDPTPQIRCMIAVVPIPPATLSVGQTYTASNYAITLANLTDTSATFQVNATQ